MNAGDSWRKVHRFNTHPLLVATIGIMAFSGVPSVSGMDIHIPEGVCMDCTNDPPSDSNGSVDRSGPSRREIREAREAARMERDRQVNFFNQQAHAAWARGDYREALRFFEQQQAVRDVKYRGRCAFYTYSGLIQEGRPFFGPLLSTVGGLVYG